MFKKIESSKDLFIITTISALIFYILAHGYRFCNAMFSGDSLYMIYQDDSAWEIALGRFVQPFLVFLRGGMESPFLFSIIAMFFVSLSAYLVVDFLEINRLLSVILVSAIMTCNSTVLATNATFLSYWDLYAIALFLSVFGVWLMKKDKLIFFFLGAFILCLSIGTYQAYICVSIGLVMIHFIFKMMEKSTFNVIWKIFQRVFNIWTANTYNGMASVGDITIASLGEVIATTYKNVFNYFIYPDTFITTVYRGKSLSIIWEYILRICNIVVCIMLAYALIWKNIKCKTNLWQRTLQIFIIVLFPFGINFVCVVTQGMQHILMIYAFYLVYILAIKVTESCQSDWIREGTIRKSSVPWLAVLGALAILTWSNIVYSNQVYEKKDLQDKATLSMMTRIVYEIESMEDYVAGVTPVAFYGSFESSPYLTEIEVFQDIKPYGMGKSAITYIGPDYSYLTYILNVNMNLTRVVDETGAIGQMPTYPTKGSVAYVDGTVVVKISDVK